MVTSVGGDACKPRWHRAGTMSENQAHGPKGAQRGDSEVPLGKTENIPGSTACLSWTWRQQHPGVESWAFSEETSLWSWGCRERQVVELVDSSLPPPRCRAQCAARC